MMTVFLVLLSAVALVGGVVLWCFGRRLHAVGAAPVPGSGRIEPANSGQGQGQGKGQGQGQGQGDGDSDGEGDGRAGLAAFYAYQLAAGKLHRGGHRGS